jgi:hypothetical protein
MRQGSWETILDWAMKFNRHLSISGWFNSEESQQRLTRVELRMIDLDFFSAEVGLRHEGVLALGEDKGFTIDAILRRAEFPIDSILVFTLSTGREISIPLEELVNERLSLSSTLDLKSRFQRLLRSNGCTNMLDVGGRDRSKIDHSQKFEGIDVTVLDIIPGANVDVVGDAHEISKLFEPNFFDAFFCLSVFEHLLMPWKVVLELNRVLKMGAVGLVYTHQTLGLHDLPWDFWRFSDQSWSALFNKQTGFEVLEAKMDHKSFVLPFFWRPDKAFAEKSAGFESSTVLVRKIGPCELTWPVELKEILSTSYPIGEDGFDPATMSPPLSF